LLTFDRRLDRAIGDALDGDAFFQPVERGLVDPAKGADPVAPDPAGGRQFQMPGQAAIIGQQQQPFRCQVQPPDRDDTRHGGRQPLEDRRAALLVAGGGDQPGRLVIAP